MKLKLAILFLLTTSLFYSQEVMIHYNFTLEKDYLNSDLTEYIYSDEIIEFDIRVFNNKKMLVYHKSLIKDDFIKEKYGNIFMTGYIYGLLKGGLNTIKISYKLRSKIRGSETFKFSYPDSVSSLALEVFFDQAKVIKMNDAPRGGFTIVDDEYEIDSKAKPVLIVKYWTNEENRILEPTWFDKRLTVRPKYIFKNNSPDTIYHATNNIMDNFSGGTKKFKDNEWLVYGYGNVCGTTNGPWKIRPNEQEITTEGFPIGTPRKLTEGLYGYSFKYSLEKHVDADGNKAVSNIYTYFIMMYAD